VHSAKQETADLCIYN